MSADGNLASTVWTLGSEDISRYDGFFALLDPDSRGIVTLHAAAPLFEKANLPPESLNGVWKLADADGDGLLDKVDFRIAMHLANQAKRGHRLPSSLPASLAISAWGGELGSGLDGEADVATGASCSSAVGTARASALSRAELLHYRGVFESNEPAPGAGLSGDVAVAVLSQSQLTMEELSHIWELADVDLDGVLDLDEFCIAMHLVARRKLGEELPSMLPVRLMHSAAIEQRAIRNSIGRSCRQCSRCTLNQPTNQ